MTKVLIVVALSWLLTSCTTTQECVQVCGKGNVKVAKHSQWRTVCRCQ